MKNIILFFLLLAFTTTHAQYWRKHAGTHFSLALHPTTYNFNIKTTPAVTLPQNAAEQFLNPNNNGFLDTDQPITPTKNFIHVSLNDPFVETDKPLHSTYVYDLKGRVVTSKLSYRIKTKH